MTAGVTKAMILAAGRGERMRPLTDHTPKPLLQVGGRSLIEWHLINLARAGVREVVINLSWLGSKISTALGDGSRWGLVIHYSDEDDNPLETGGGIFRALPRLGSEPFWLVNGDVFSDYDFSRAPALDVQALARLVLVANPTHHPRGDFVFLPAKRDGLSLAKPITGTAPSNRGLDAAIGFDDSAEAKRWTYSGLGLYRAEFFAGCEGGRFPLLPWLRRAAEAQKLRGLIHEGHWCDVGTPERLRELDERLAAGAVG